MTPYQYFNLSLQAILVVVFVYCFWQMYAMRRSVRDFWNEQEQYLDLAIAMLDVVYDHLHMRDDHEMANKVWDVLQTCRKYQKRHETWRDKLEPKEIVGKEKQ